MTDINEIIRAAVQELMEETVPPAAGAAVVKALGEAGYEIVDSNEITQRISDAIRDADERRD